MNIKRSLIICFAFVLLVLFSGRVYKAKAATPADNPTASGTTDLTAPVKAFYETFPAVSIDSVSLPKKEYQAGDTVSGSFIMRNEKDFDVPDVSYDIALAGNYDKSGLAGIFYDKVRHQALYLKANETKIIKFSYKIGANVSGNDLGLEVRAVLKNGLYLGWADAHIKVTGGQGFLELSNASIEIAGKTYGLEAGPTVEKDGSVFLNAELNNKLGADVNVTPVLVVHTFLSSSAPTILKQSSFLVKKGAKSSVHISLPLFDNKPGVYVGELSFFDEANAKVAASLEFRYIIGGDIINFQSISADQTSLNKGDQFKVTLTYSGMPADITNLSEAPKKNPLDLSVKIFNEKNELVAEQVQKNYDINSGSLLSMPFTAAFASKGLRVEVAAYRGTTLLASYNSNLSANYAELQKKALAEKAAAEKVKAVIMFSVALVLIIALLVFVKITKHRSMLAVLALMAISSAFFGPHKAEASFVVDHASVYYYSIHDWSRTFLSGGSPDGVVVTSSQVTDIGGGPQTTLAPGQPFYLFGSLQALACGNSATFRIKITATYRGTTVFDYVDTLTTNDNPNINNASKFKITVPAFSLGAFTAYNGANAPGSLETVYLTIETSRKNVDGTWDKWVKLEGHTNFTIVSKPTVSLTATPNPVAYNGSTKLTWTPGNWTTKTVNDVVTQTDDFKSCAASSNPNDSNWTGSKSIFAGSTQSVSDITSSKTFNITCTKVYHGISILSDVSSVTVTAGVPPPLTATLTASPSTINNGDSSYLTWTSNGDECHAVPSTDFNTGNEPNNIVGVAVYPTSDKTYNITCTRNNPSGSINKSASVTVNTCSGSCGFQASCNASPNPANTGVQVSWNAVASGGSVPYTYKWTGQTDFSPSQNYPQTYTTAGTKNMGVIAKDSTGATYTATCANLTVNNVTFTCWPEDPVTGAKFSQAQVGHKVKWVAEPNNNAYAWSSPDGVVSETGASKTVIYNTIGSKSVNVSLNGGASAQCTVFGTNDTNLKVGVNPIYIEK